MGQAFRNRAIQTTDRERAEQMLAEAPDNVFVPSPVAGND
jgi:hypothetical protein